MNLYAYYVYRIDTVSHIYKAFPGHFLQKVNFCLNQRYQDLIISSVIKTDIIRYDLLTNSPALKLSDKKYDYVVIEK